MARILLLEDDESLRPALSLILIQAGHTVMAAGDGEQGLALLGRFRPEVLVTDIVMPEKDGTAVLMEMRKVRGAVKIIAMSGGGRQSPDDYLHVATLLGADRVLPKPFSREALLAAVESVLAEGAASLPGTAPAPEPSA